MSDPAVIAALGALSVFFVSFAMAEAAGARTRRLRGRIDRFVIAEATAGGMAAPPRRSAAGALLASLRAVGKPLSGLTRERGRASVEHALFEAGATDLGTDAYIEARAGAMVVGGIAGALAGLLVGSVELAALLAVLGLAAGRLVPEAILARRARARRTRILVALPAALDMLALCADAGLGLDGAVQQVVRRWDNPLTAELRRFLTELRIGRDRRQAIREMAQRTGVREVSRFANAVVQADTLGVPLARVMQEQAAEVRLRRRQKAEESARKAPIKMLFPMVLLIFPALFIVILGPAVPQMMGALGGR